MPGKNCFIYGPFSVFPIFFFKFSVLELLLSTLHILMNFAACFATQSISNYLNSTDAYRYNVDNFVCLAASVGFIPLCNSVNTQNSPTVDFLIEKLKYLLSTSVSISK